MTRLRLFQIRLAATAGLLLVICVLVRLLWYPGGYFAISGVGELLLILAAVALIVGPCLSAFVYRPGKKGLLTDLGLLATVELVAVVLAVSIIYARQPFYTVFAVDRFESVPRSQVDSAEILYASLNTRPGHAPRLVYAELPRDEDKLSRLMDETLFEGKEDIDRRPEFWKPYSAGLAALKAAAKPLESLLEGDAGRAAKVRRWLLRRGGSIGDYICLPLRGKAGDALMIVHADIGYPVGILAVDPW